MKKLLLILAALLLVIVISAYVFIPSNLDISAAAKAKTTVDGTYRVISSKTFWQKWWDFNSKQKEVNQDTVFRNGDYVYNLTASSFNNALVSIQHKGKGIESKISLVQLATDSIGIMWQCQLIATFNPFTRIQRYFEAVNIKKNIVQVLDNLRLFAEDDKNIYGIKISESSIKDSFLISEKKLFTHEPTMDEVYALINDLKECAAKNNCIQTNAPMLNVLNDSGEYRVMVALPVNKKIAEQSGVSWIKMVKGNYMIAEVRGGLGTVQNALMQMQNYFSDYNKTSMAIPFQYLVTDRMKEKDTTKWITEIYAPVL